MPGPKAPGLGEFECIVISFLLWTIMQTSLQESTKVAEVDLQMRTASLEPIKLRGGLYNHVQLK